MCEKWLPVKDFEDYYMISDAGNLKFIGICGNQYSDTNRIKKLSKDKDGYLFATLYKKEKIKSYRVHRLVIGTFLEPSSLEVNHINGIKTDNRLCNLEYCTRLENEKHAWKTGLKKSGIYGKEVSQFTKEGIFIRKYTSRTLAEKETFIPHGLISACARGEQHTAGGYKWK